MKELYLIYINLLGTDYKEEYNYEFIFSDTLDNIDGEDWDLKPASGQPSPPNRYLISKVGMLTSTIKLDVVQNSDTFAVWDSIDGIISLGWENIEDYEEYPEVRLVFNYGEPINVVQDKLYEKDFVLDYKFDKNGVKEQEKNSE